MISEEKHEGPFSILSYQKDAMAYAADAWQRSFLFMDTLRKRGNNSFSHLKAGQPPVLTFQYRTIMSGRTLTRPVNYSLVQIIDRRLNGSEIPVSSEELRRKPEFQGDPAEPRTRPIVIIDPRAGHGPGIGGSKRDSEIGIAMDLGHPVYFINFETDPVPGQTLADVHKAEILFIEKVSELHPEAERPAIIGNCQAGWAAALIGSDRPEITGPLVFNGSPLSYWAGVEGRNPMRYKGGLCGGTWMTSLWCDLGNGKFDGANLVWGFEDLNPANTLWKKLYNVYSHVDTEEKRFLDFEKWWNGFFYMTSKEILFIVNNLFVGNRLEKGFIEFDDGRQINLRNIKSPVLVFASSGDNITPPQQALNWICKVWETVDEIKRCQQVVVFLLHETIGHLGIFVSGKVSKKEHKQIIGSVDLIGYLSPGLYEMVIVEGEVVDGVMDHDFRFEERTMEDILKLDDGQLDEENFKVVDTVSTLNDDLYQAYVSPWVRTFSSDFSAQALREMHPLRWGTHAFSDSNPALVPARIMAEQARENRVSLNGDNVFSALEKLAAGGIEEQLELYRKLRDDTQEFVFKSIYGNPLVEAFFKPMAEADSFFNEDKQPIFDGLKVAEAQYWEKDVEKGGFAEGILRIMTAMVSMDQSHEKKELTLIRELIQKYNVLSRTNEAEIREKLQDQARILQVHNHAAIEALPRLIRGPEKRLVAIHIAESMADADKGIGEREQKLLQRIKVLLKDKKTL